MRANNRGFTLVELIVVLVIICIVSALVGLSVSAINSIRAEKAASTVNALISKCRVGCLSRAGDVHLTVALDSSEDIVCTYFENGIVSETDIIDGNGISIVCNMRQTDSNIISRTLSASTELALSFDRSTGGQKAQPDGSYCTAISFIGNRTCTIELVPSTGNHKLS